MFVNILEMKIYGSKKLVELFFYSFMMLTIIVNKFTQIDQFLMNKQIHY